MASKRTKPKGSADAEEVTKRPQEARQAAKSAKGVKGSRARGKVPVSIGAESGQPEKRTNIETRFKPGNNANPAGRPKGSRNKLSESFIARMHADFEQHGDTVIEAVRTESPGEYLRIIASIVPKQFGIEEGTQDCFLQVWTAISEGRA